MKRMSFLLFLSALLPLARAEEPAVEAPTAPAPAETNAVAAPAPASEAATAPAAKIVVILPEQVDTEWFWYYYSDTSQHLVQSRVESALTRAGFDVIDVATLKKLEREGSLENVTSTAGARKIAQDAGATYVIVGKATAVKAGQGDAYGVPVIRSQAEITARIIRVSDGKVIESAEASAQKGGQAPRTASQEALKTAGEQIGRKLAAALQKASAPAP